MTPSDADADHFRDAVAGANIPTLLMMLVQMTGDMSWLEAPYLPSRGKGMDENETGGLAVDVQDTVRAAALDAILAWRAGKPLALADPDDALSVRMLAVAMGEPVPDSYAPIIQHGLGLTQPEAKTFDLPTGTRAIIIGAGISGLCAAKRFDDGGVPYVIIEKNDTVGGTWLENTYPGAGVDTPNYLYSFSFAKNDWGRYFALRDEIYGYLERVADDFDIRKNIRFNTTVTQARFNEADATWSVDITNPDGSTETLTERILLSAVGILNVPQPAPVKGIDTFTGQTFHTARWPAGLDLTGKKVALIGNGASAMQVVPAITDKVDTLTIFQRSKQWAAPFPQFQKSVPEGVRLLLREVPAYLNWYRLRLAWTFNDRVHSSLQKDPDWAHPDRAINAVNDAHRQFFSNYIKEELGDRQDMLPQVLPDFPPYGKRMLLDNGWYRAVARDNVNLVNGGLAEVRGDKLIGADGKTYDAEILIQATGFKAANFLGSYKVIGRDGVELSDIWGKDDARAYIGTAVPGFPNLFIILGPNIGLGHGGSMIGAIERQVNYIMSLVEKMGDARASALEVKPEVHDAYNRKVDDAHEKMVWTHRGMENWYRNSRGRVIAITPWRHDTFWELTKEADLNDFIVHMHKDAKAKVAAE
ncbi:MAG: NAD(P)/FAD-dependent oxidoreductase [Gemmobacter sp.]|nr:NAD(P)/FAD-dependent oxidoreductase [Gemmobacter sp.]